MMQHLVNATTHAKKATVSQWCRVLGVSRSGLYAARQPQSICALSVQAKTAFEASVQSYGSRRLSAALKVQGLAVGRQRARQSSPEAPNRAWVGDMTYIYTRSGWLYMAMVLDLFSRPAVGWSMAPGMPAQLVCAALGMAIASRQPVPCLLVHSDRGSQGGFNRSSQHWVAERILGTRSWFRLAPSSRAFYGVWRPARERQRGSLERSTKRSAPGLN